MAKCSRTVVAQNDYFYVTPGLSVKNFPQDAQGHAVLRPLLYFALRAL